MKIQPASILRSEESHPKQRMFCMFMVNLIHGEQLVFKPLTILNRQQSLSLKVLITPNFRFLFAVLINSPILETFAGASQSNDMTPISEEDSAALVEAKELIKETVNSWIRAAQNVNKVTL